MEDLIKAEIRSCPAAKVTSVFTESFESTKHKSNALSYADVWLVSPTGIEVRVFPLARLRIKFASAESDS